MLFGLPLIAMLIALNALWAVVLTRLRQADDRAWRLAAAHRRFCRDVCARSSAPTAPSSLRSSAYAGSEIYIYNYPYLIVPMLFGLGAPPIILDTTFKVFRGGATIFGAVCDILVPRQTSALAERDGPTLVRATLLAAALCSIPAAIACAHSASSPPTNYSPSCSAMRRPCRRRRRRS